MEELRVIEDISYAKNWILHNQETFSNYFVNLVSASIILTIGSFIAKIFSSGINKILLNRKIDSTISNFLSSLLKYVVITFTLVTTLGCLGVQTTSVIAILGAAGMAIGLALQGSLSNFAAGVLLVALRPLKSGEYVDLGGIAGNVLNIHIFYTMLKTLDGKIVVIPNGRIISGNIINYSREPTRRNEFKINVSYQSDLDEVIKIIREVLLKEDRVIKSKDITIGISEFGSSSIVLIIRCWSNTHELNAVYWDLMMKFKKSFDKNKINIPIPQIDIYLNKNKELN
ncbi:small-conductance mechanosensitive channel MscS [Buchnera aphidicola (Kurisakia onigurumii)]|uniref:small-conductance mechanosensitive channel MscS n=1 Tax=Buchnera aphidicola TaxID=9 RepID=UPI0031B73181